MPRSALISRRSLLAIPAALAAGPAAASPSSAFPRGFTWGLAASAPQTESAAGRGRSIWDVFAAEPGRIKDGSRPDVCTAFDQRYPADLDLVAQAGFNAFRFSVAWPRVQPDGRGAASPVGLDLYDRMVDAMLSRRITPWVTLFHWDLPAALPGGWLERDTCARFADYAALVGRRLGDRARHFIMLNEPSVVAVLGHAYGGHAPGLHSREAWAAATHHQNLAQGLGFAALRAALPRPAAVGTTLALSPVHPADASPEAAAAARAMDDAWNRAFLDPLFGQPYPRSLDADMAKLLRPGDLAHIAARPDFLGVNYYARSHVKAAPGSVLGAASGPPPAGTPRTGIGWAIEPGGLVEELRGIRDSYGNPAVYITETGAAFPDPAPAPQGIIPDPARVDFLRAYLGAAAQAAAEGCRLGGVFAWTLTDNWEWAEGYGPRFGLVQVDRATLRRTPRQSLGWLGRCARANRVV